MTSLQTPTAAGMAGRKIRDLGVVLKAGGAGGPVVRAASTLGQSTPALRTRADTGKITVNRGGQGRDGQPSLSASKTGWTFLNRPGATTLNRVYTYGGKESRDIKPN